MDINILHDIRAIDRLSPLVDELKGQGILDYKIWHPVEDTSSVVRSINLSHKAIVEDAKNRGIKEVCIIEDDCTFTCKDSWRYFLSNKPKDYDLYLWGSFLIPITNGMVCGFHLYCVSEKFYDKFLSLPPDIHIDTGMDVLKGDYHFCYPFPALQRKGFSFNNKCDVDYSSVLSEKDIYKI
jgi:hypothetical protein